VFRLVVVQFKQLGGGTGVSLQALNAFEPVIRQAMVYWCALAALVLFLTVLILVVRGRYGSWLQAIRDDEIAATSLGVPVARVKRIIFVVAALGCGAAGALTVANTLRVQPNSIFGVQWTAYMIFMVLIGGIRTIEGPIVGAIVFFLVQEQFAVYGSWYLIALGLIAVVVTLAAPKGLWGTLAGRFRISLAPVGRLVVPLRIEPLRPGADLPAEVCACG